MTDSELLNYIQRILQTCSDTKAQLTLSELRDILSRYVTPPQQMQMLDRAIENVPEARSEACSAPGRALTETDLRIAARRGEERRRRERELEDQGRC